MQVFNEINSRRIVEFNVFEDFFNNTLFIGILLVTVLAQICIVQFGGIAVKCSPLSFNMHLVCITVAAFSIPLGFVFKMIPETWFKFVKFNEKV